MIRAILIYAFLITLNVVIIRHVPTEWFHHCLVIPVISAIWAWREIWHIAANATARAILADASERPHVDVPAPRQSVSFPR